MITFKQFLTEALQLDEAFSAEVFEGNINTSDIKKIGRALANSMFYLDEMDFRSVDPTQFGFNTRVDIDGKVLFKFTKLPKEFKEHTGKAKIVVFVDTASKDIVVFHVNKMSANPYHRSLVFKKSVDERLKHVTDENSEQLVDYMRDMVKRKSTVAYVAYVEDKHFMRGDSVLPTARWRLHKPEIEARRARNSIVNMIPERFQYTDLFKKIKQAARKNGIEMYELVTRKKRKSYDNFLDNMDLELNVKISKSLDNKTKEFANAKSLIFKFVLNMDPNAKRFTECEEGTRQWIYGKFDEETARVVYEMVQSFANDLNKIPKAMVEDFKKEILAYIEKQGIYVDKEVDFDYRYF